MPRRPYRRQPWRSWRFCPPVTRRTVCYFPGSTIGNLTADEAVAFLRRVAAVCGPEGGLLVGTDLVKDTAVLLPAYDDAR